MARNRNATNRRAAPGGPRSEVVGGGAPLNAYPNWDAEREVLVVCDNERDPSSSYYRDLEGSSRNGTRRLGGAADIVEEMDLATLEHLTAKYTAELSATHPERAESVAIASTEARPAARPNGTAKTLPPQSRRRQR